ncbi:MAG: type II secretion system protein GspG [Planctomycetaceae bacterium]|jgi:hypothetical protein|nr:type II secretion system protein GspG [Planctomycetaceae bacterium]
MVSEFSKGDLLAVGVKKRSWFSRRLLFVFVMFLVFCVVMFYFCFVPSRLVISPDTTFVTEYLTPEGLPDYSAAYLKKNNAQLQNHEDNGYRLVLEAFGPYILWHTIMKNIAWEDLPTHRKYGRWYTGTWVPICEAMSIDPTKKPKEYTSIYDFYVEAIGQDSEAKKLRKLRQKLKELGAKPWRTEAHPEIAELLNQSAEALDLFSFAAKKPIWICYQPQNNLAHRLNPIFCWDVASLYSVCVDLSIRVSRRLGENDVVGALDDAFAILRIARHYKSHYTYYEHRRAFEMEEIGMKSLQSILVYGNLNSDQIRQLLKEFDSLPKHEDSFEKFVQFEKLVYLEAILSPLKHDLWRGIVYENLDHNISDHHTAIELIWHKPYIKKILELPVDLNYAAKRGLLRWRFLDSAAKEKDIRKRWQLIEEHYDEARNIYNQIFNLQVMSLTPLIRIRSQVFADIIFNKFGCSAVFLYYTKEEKKIVTIHNLFYVSSALELYQRDNGNYPDSLDAITPKYLEKIPIDFFSTDNKFTYKKTDTGYILYSFGLNEKDDGGEEKEGYGDIIVERKK